MHSHVIIIGGGLAGLTSAIHLARAGVPVTLIEKNVYPKHKVCGEYISNEVLPYFDFLDIDIQSLQPTNISKFLITTKKGNCIESELPLGGFGVSRYTLDYYLWKKATVSGVQLIQDQVIDIKYKQDTGFKIETAKNQMLTSDYVIGAYGKRAQLDKKLQRDFSLKKSSWLAVKSHYTTNFEPNTVSLHNFDGGYCGLSMIEEQKVNACYLVAYDSFKKHKNITGFQKEIMEQNPYLHSFFKEATLLFEKPITISQINFDKKKAVENHILMTGDAAGLIHPLCGNGMAMAIQSAQIVSKLLATNYFETTKKSRKEIEKLYKKQWDQAFSKRLYTGRVLQKILLNDRLQELSYTLANTMPAIVSKIIKQTHGAPLIC
ncbi:NAD(P)/FAD-dependent oxidoreductase [Aquimarina sp. I32.4]|uniref:NAD(P)/FAD-dependent oxidoreductase n=1 Tax=Aquimarina sp. I32.4 TaxID=2053903 RepID=UPI000CDEAD68|nr:NAD(P)/FAD-dependent oxidoreductase [Aquimarina sp. I32.4]